MRRRPIVAWTTLAVVLLGCASPNVPQRQPEAVDDGVQATGRLDGRRIAISDGAPETSLTDCDPGGMPDEDVCWIARTIDGVTVAFVVENPAALAAGQSVRVRDADCDTCDDVEDHAVVDLRVDGTQQRAASGRLEVQQVGERYAADFDVRFLSGDTLTGSFNIRQLAPDEL